MKRLSCKKKKKRCSQLSKSWTKAYSNSDNHHCLICSFGAFSGMLSTKIFKSRSTAEYGPSLFLPCIFFTKALKFRLKKKKKKKQRRKNGNKSTHSVDRGDVGIARVVSHATFQQSLARRDLIQGFAQKKCITMAVHCHTLLFHNLSSSKQGVKGTPHSPAVLAFYTVYKPGW